MGVRVGGGGVGGWGGAGGSCAYNAVLKQVFCGAVVVCAVAFPFKATTLLHVVGH